MRIDPDAHGFLGCLLGHAGPLMMIVARAQAAVILGLALGLALGVTR